MTAGAGGASSAFYGTIQNGPGGVALSKTGSGVLALYGNNTYTGGTSLTAGVLQIGSNSAVGNGTLTLGGGTLATAGGS